MARGAIGSAVLQYHVRAMPLDARLKGGRADAERIALEGGGRRGDDAASPPSRCP